MTLLLLLHGDNSTHDGGLLVGDDAPQLVEPQKTSVIKVANDDNEIEIILRLLDALDD